MVKRVFQSREKKLQRYCSARVVTFSAFPGPLCAAPLIIGAGAEWTVITQPSVLRDFGIILGESSLKLSILAFRDLSAGKYLAVNKLCSPFRVARHPPVQLPSFLITTEHPLKSSNLSNLRVTPTYLAIAENF